MNISIPGYSETSPTYFNIQISFDRTTYHVKRRYSEFVKFVEAIEEEMGEQAPVDLPGKKWIGTKNREFLDDRRRALELFLRALAKKDEWRESLAFMDFLEVSKHAKSESSVAAKARGDWLKMESEASSLIQKALKSKQLMASGIGGPTEAAEHRRLVVLSRSKIKHLESVLSSDNSLGDGEYRRRRDIVQNLKLALRNGENTSSSPFGSNMSSGAGNGISSAFNQTSSLSGASGTGVSSPLSSRSPSRTSTPTRILGAPAPETGRTRQLNNSGLLALQKSDMEEQDRTVESLRQTIEQQKRLGLAINEELTFQNQLLDELDDETHRVNSRLNQAKRRTGNLAN
ncbi:hypothetical protein AWJ20_4655 [Sugiyamaella lignohabitans]|uniref:Vam7p n=1 Tax=Sugiyamaella lignohabitans TaxID=796027 RepID=A0A167E6P0_9ASCO|nr:uncharacterized protein AWJ20_4655 [Sugiyamaella lignohabitans]ANB13712.1 hypothetical protein AWJ20_4655 [Sugiyamaella lignohabitans]